MKMIEDLTKIIEENKILLADRKRYITLLDMPPDDEIIKIEENIKALEEHLNYIKNLE